MGAVQTIIFSFAFVRRGTLNREVVGYIIPGEFLGILKPLGPPESSVLWVSRPIYHRGRRPYLMGVSHGGSLGHLSRRLSCWPSAVKID